MANPMKVLEILSQTGFLVLILPFRFLFATIALVLSAIVWIFHRPSFDPDWRDTFKDLCFGRGPLFPGANTPD